MKIATWTGKLAFIAAMYTLMEPLMKLTHMILMSMKKMIATMTLMLFHGTVTTIPLEITSMLGSHSMLMKTYQAISMSHQILITPMNCIMMDLETKD